MSEEFEAKVRMVGTSLGVLIPKEVVKQENLKPGENVEVILVKRNVNRQDLLEKALGMARGLGPFHREHKDREL